MTTYSKITVGAMVSENADFSSPDTAYYPSAQDPADLTGTSNVVERIKATLSMGVTKTISFAPTTKVAQLIVKNNNDPSVASGAYYVGVEFKNKANTTVTLRVYPGQIMAVPDLKTGEDIELTADVEDVDVDVLLLGNQP